MPVDLVTFDAGQTLVDLDLDFLVAKLRERGVVAEGQALAGAAPGAWAHYNAHIRAGGGRTWQAFMTALLAGAGVAGADGLADELFDDQPRRNLWRKPISAMVAIARELAARGVRVAVLSNSEGRLAELLADVGIADAFVDIIDSGCVGVEKPDPRIFELTLARVGGRPETTVHVGDSWAADVVGAVGAGWRVVWYRTRGELGGEASERVAIATSATEVGECLARFSGARG